MSETGCCGPSCCGGSGATTDDRPLVEQVRARYAEAAVAAAQGDRPACSPEEEGGVFGARLYGEEETGSAPERAVAASLGCGVPTAVADLRPGEVVLDLGSGGGLDVIVSARRVGPTGLAYGLDMTPEMLDLARANAREAGVANTRFLEGRIESVPLPDASVDVVISNCVVNLSTDKPAVFREVHRVLRPGGRIGISDVVADDRLTPEERAARGSHVGCIAGALAVGEYRELLEEAGMRDVEVRPTHEVADGMYAAVVRAVRPG